MNRFPPIVHNFDIGVHNFDIGGGGAAQAKASRRLSRRPRDASIGAGSAKTESKT
jgi:hypothetical protein